MHRSWSSKTRNHAGPNHCASITSRFASFGNIPTNSLYDENRLLSTKFFANLFSLITNRYVKEDWAGNRDLRDPEQTPKRNTPFFRLEWATEAGRFTPNHLITNTLNHYDETDLSRQLTIHSRTRWDSSHTTLPRLGWIRNPTSTGNHR